MHKDAGIHQIECIDMPYQYRIIGKSFSNWII